MCAHIDVHTRVARDAGDVARGDEARMRLVRKRRIVITFRRSLRDVFHPFRRRRRAPFLNRVCFSYARR